jgi:hypothetical protein
LITGECDERADSMADRLAVTGAWLREAWINLRYDPARLVLAFHFSHKPLWWAERGEFECTRCGSTAPDVQAAGRRKAESIRRTFA